MRRFSSILILLLACLALLPAPPAAAWLFGNDTLVTIDGVRYTSEDFKRWWKFWQEADQPLPKTPDPYIDWLLLAREGERMQLDEDPGFKRQTRVFLQSRTLLMLKYEAVDSQVEVPEADIKAKYEELYLPRWEVQNLTFKSEEEAKAAWDELAAGSLKIDELFARDPEQGGPVESQATWVWPKAIDPGWAAIFRKLAVGEVVNPSEHKGGVNLFYLKDQKGADEEDYAKLREDLRKDLWRKKEDDLTHELIGELRHKYQVVVDEERIAALDLNAPDDSFTDAVVISSTEQKVTERDFIAVIRKLMGSRPQAGHAAGDEELARKLKADTVENIIAQSVTNWESLDRHYEEREPFKWEYQFNYRHRLVLALEGRLFLADAQVTDDEIKRHYEENIDRYTQPGLVKVNIIDETQGPVAQVWADVMTGKDFKEAVRQRFEMDVATQEIPANHLDPEVKAVVDKLAVGETSPIFKAQGSRVLVNLVARIPANPLPLERVADTIRTTLQKKKVEQARKDYLETLKSRSQIEVRKREWKAIQKELGGA